ncbi:MAG: homoaconitase [Phycisphaeraceae bacterium]|nr:homoaconitase [Phycisphaeraceae bacterium]
MSLTRVEKIANRYAAGLAPGQTVRSGQIIRIRPKHVMTHDNTGAVIPKFRSIFEGTGREPSIADPRQPVFAIDHDIQNLSPENLGKYAKIRSFATEHGVDFYPAGTGISHQVMVEQGYVVPGSLVVGSDSHSNLYGGVGALGTPVVRTDAACLWATGSTWWMVPRVARCELTGRLAPGVVGKDVIIALCGLFNQDEVLNHAVEFTGDGVAALSIDQRLSIANMTTEWGALAGVFPFDERLRDYLLSRAEMFETSRRPGERREGSLGSYTREDVEAWWERSDAAPAGATSSARDHGCRLAADPDAQYAVDLTIDLSTIIPHVSGPNDVKTTVSLPEMERRRVPIQKAWLMSCVNARDEDIAEAARIVRGRRVAPRVEFYLAAASAEVQERARARGDWQSLLDAGAIELPPGCGTCIGLGRGTIRAGEVGISATNRNFEGRMGDREGQVYLGSPGVVAASAIAGYVTAPTRFEDRPARHTIRREGERRPSVRAGETIPGFPTTLRGRTLFLPKDNLNTDGIFAGKWTYKDDLAAEQMRAVTFENYDPQFNKLYQYGDIVVAGRNFGTGSSREQAATSLKLKGVPCVIAASFSETYARNAFNNGLLCLESPGLVDHLSETLMEAGSDSRTIPGPEVEVDFGISVVRCDGREFEFPTLSPVAQELIVAGGAEAVARASLTIR